MKMEVTMIFLNQTKKVIWEWVTQKEVEEGEIQEENPSPNPAVMTTHSYDLDANFSSLLFSLPTPLTHCLILLFLSLP